MSGNDISIFSFKTIRLGVHHSVIKFDIFLNGAPSSNNTLTKSSLFLEFNKETVIYI